VVAQSLSDLVNFCTPVKFRSLRHLLSEGKYYEMTSLGEIKAEGLIEDHGATLIELTKRQNTRIYPKGTRVDSRSVSFCSFFLFSILFIVLSEYLSSPIPCSSISNYNPVPFWGAGCQMVSLNYQTNDTALQMNEALFRKNGGCGYVLKPPMLRSPHKVPFNPQKISFNESILFSTSARVRECMMQSSLKP